MRSCFLVDIVYIVERVTYYLLLTTHYSKPIPTLYKFQLKGEEYIELNKLLKIANLVETGGQANQMITEGMVLVNGEIESRKRRKMRAGDMAEFFGEKVKVEK